MAKNHKENMRTFFKFLTLAQTASDAGKFNFAPSHNNGAAVREGYGLKDQYILAAARVAKRAGAKVWWEASDIPALRTIIYFETAFGQVSFHSHISEMVCDKIAPAPKRRWNGIRGGSLRVCSKAAATLQLQTI